jgi:glycolate oxidase
VPFLDALRSRLPDLRVLDDPVDLESHRHDETPYLPAGMPIGVALPTTTSEVQEIVRLAGEFAVPLVPRGAGTGLSGGANAIDGGLVVSFARMDRIVEIDRENLAAVVEPGVVNATLKAAVAAEGLFYPPDPASYESCTIGGNLGTNAGGLCCIKYGVTRDSVLGAEVVLANGSIVRTGGKTTKDVAGYDLTGLFVGAQGTLGLITQATLRLRPAPPPKSTLLAFFDSLAAAGNSVSGLVTRGVQPCTLELMDRFTIAAVDDWQHLGLDREAAAMLLIESDLPGLAAGAELDAAAEVCEANGATSIVRSADPQEADWLRQARRMAFHALERLGEVRMEDVGVPRSRVTEMLVEIERVAAFHELTCGTFGHIGDGNLHPNFVVERGDTDAAARVGRASKDLYRAAIALGGTVTAEHGIGTARRDFLELQRGSEAVRVMRAIKDALDPQGILNPGKVLPAI